MSSKKAREAMELFHTYEVKCDEKLIREWLNDNHTEMINGPITEEHVWEFNDWMRKKGTAYEEGIDDKTKIERLQIEIQDLKKEIDTLRDEKIHLEFELGISPFN